MAFVLRPWDFVLIMSATRFHAHVLELIRRTSAFLPPDVTQVLEMHRALEQAGSKASLALDLVTQNIGLAKRLSAPICQDTGTITFYLHTPVGFDQLELEELCCEAVVEATAKGYLRQNSVESVSGKNTGNNLGAGSPVFHWHQHRKDTIDTRLVLKGGGCENMSAQYSLPATLGGKRCDRDLDGVRACILDAVWNAQGKVCGPGFLGVCIGGDRAVGYEFAKEQLLRELDDTNPVPELAALEARKLERVASLQKLLEDRAQKEISDTTAILEELRAGILAELRQDGDVVQLQLFSLDERQQYDEDRRFLERRLAEIPDEIERETAAIRKRFANPEPSLFPVAITYLVPERFATR